MGHSKHASDYAKWLSTGSWFRSLGASTQQALLGIAKVKRLDRTERLFSRGDAPDGLYAVLEGQLRVTGHTAQGHDVLLTMLEPPAWFGEVAVFDEGPRTHDVSAEKPSQLVHLPRAALEALLAKTPTLWRQLGSLMAQQLRLTFIMIEELTNLPPATRLAHRLLLLARGSIIGPEHDRRVIKTSQQQLASMLGVSRQTVNELLKDFEARGAVKRVYGGIEIVDLQRLDAALPERT